MAYSPTAAARSTPVGGIPAPTRESVADRIDNFAQRIHARAENIAQIKDRVRDLADRLHGNQPTEAGNVLKEARSATAFANFEEADQRLVNAIAELDAQIFRL